MMKLREDRFETLFDDLLDSGGVPLMPGQRAAEVFRVNSEEMKGAGIWRGLLHEVSHGVGLASREAAYLSRLRPRS